MTNQQKLTISQSARHIGLSAERVRQLAKADLLPCEVTPLGRLFEPDDLDAFIESRRRREAGDPQ